MTALVVLSSFGGGVVMGVTINGGNAAESTAGPAPSVVMPNATVDDDGSKSKIRIAYNASDIPLSDLELSVSAPDFYASASKGSAYHFESKLTDNNGTATVVIPTDALGGGELPFTVRVRNASAPRGEQTRATDRGYVTVESNVTLEYTVVNTTAYTGQNVTVNATLTNTASKAESYTVGLYSNGYRRDAKQVTVEAGKTRNVSFNYTSNWAGTRHVTVNTEPTTAVEFTSPVQFENYSVQNRTVAVGERFNITVNVSNPTDYEGTRTVFGYNGTGSVSKRVTLAPHTNKTLTFETVYTEAGEYHVSFNGTRTDVAALGPNASEANLAVTDARDVTSIPNRKVYLPVEISNTGSAGGAMNVTLAEGGSVVATEMEYVAVNATEYAVFERNYTQTGNYTLTVSGEHRINVTIREPVVENVSVEHVGGPAPDSLPALEARLGGAGMIMVTPANGWELNDSGVTTDTKLRINITTQNYTPRVVLSNGGNISWSVVNTSATNKTVSVTVTPSQMNFLFNAPRIENWESADRRANVTFNATLLMGIASAENAPYDASPEQLRNLTITTDAQKFRPPRYHAGDNDTAPWIEVKLAAPHYTAYGNVNDGFYRAYLPDSLLSAWNVTDPDQLTATYTAGDTTYTAREVPGGMVVRVDLHYSSGTVRITKDTSSSSTTDSTTSTTDDDHVWVSPDETEPTTPPQETVSVRTDGGTAIATVDNPNGSVELDLPTGNANGTAALDELALNVTETERFNVSVESHTEAPETVETALPEGTDAVSYVSVDHPTLSDTEIESANLTYAVPRGELSDVNASELTVYRLHNGSWQSLPTSVEATNSSYRVTADAPGLSVFAVGTVEPAFEVTDASVATGTIQVGEKTTVSATIANDGQEGGTYTAALRVDGETVETKRVQVSANATRMVTFTPTFDAAGEHTVAINGTTAGGVTAEATPTSTPTTTPTETSTETTTDASGPGFTAVTALLAVVVLLGFRRH